MNLLTRCTNPVPFFLILSGYGLYRSIAGGSGKSPWTRILRLYIHYWITLAFFVPIGAFVVGTQSYPGSFGTVMSNLTGWSTTYNGEVWFLFPYCILVLLSSRIFKLVNSWHWLLVFGVSGIIYFFSYLAIHLYGAVYLYNHMFAYMPVLVGSLLFPFCIGMLMAKYIDSDRLKTVFADRRLLGFSLLICLCLLRLCFRTMFFNPIYAAGFILLFSSLPHLGITRNILAEFGRRSTSMWFIHTYFCYYLFHDFIYSFKYPVIIFLVLLAISYIAAILIDAVRDALLRMT